jgi:hypothetical protein
MAGRYYLTLEGLRSIAFYQRMILICILVYLTFAIGMFFVPPVLRIVFVVVFGLSAITAAVFVFFLSIRVYGIALGIILGICTLIPWAGLLVLLIINGRATAELTRHDIRVGLMGARSSDLVDLDRDCVEVECSACGANCLVMMDRLGKPFRCQGCGQTFFAEQPAERKTRFASDDERIRSSREETR